MRGGLDRSPFPSAVEKLLNPCAVPKHGPERWRQGLGARCFRGLWLTGGLRALQQYYKKIYTTLYRFWRCWWCEARHPQPPPWLRRHRDMKNPSVPWTWGKKVRQWAGEPSSTSANAAASAASAAATASAAPLPLPSPPPWPDGKTKNGHGAHPSRAYSSDASHALATSSFSSSSTEHVAYTTRRDTEAARLSSESWSWIEGKGVW